MVQLDMIALLLRCGLAAKTQEAQLWLGWPTHGPI